MTEQKVETAAAVATTGTVVRPNTENYTKIKTASGNSSLHNGDVVASTLASLTLGETFQAAVAMGVEPKKEFDTLGQQYGHLNLGMQRMNLGNRIRGIIAQLNKGNAKDIEKVEKANAKLLKKHEDDVAKSITAHEKLVAAAKDGETVAERAVIEAPTLAEVPELVTGQGEAKFIEVCGQFSEAIATRAAEAEAAAKAKADEKAEKAAEKAAKDAEKAAKAEAKKDGDLAETGEEESAE